MTRTLRAILGVVLILVTAFATVSVFENLGRGVRADCTEDKLYTLSDGTHAIIDKIRLPVTLKLYYSKTAANQATDYMKRFNDYFAYVRDLLERYAAAGGENVKLEVIDPRPYSEAEQDALEYGLKQFRVTEDETFFFGMVVESARGAKEVLEFLDPERETLIEYDVTSAVDGVITRRKKRIGVLSSLPVMGASPRMQQVQARHRRRPQRPWFIIEELQQRYDVREVAEDTDTIAENVDILLVIHPKDLPAETRFAIDQFVLSGGRAIICVDPLCVMDQPQDQRAMMMGGMDQGSNLPDLLAAWGVQLGEDVVADPDLAAKVPTRAEGPQFHLAILELDDEAMGAASPMSAGLQACSLLFAGSLAPTDADEATLTPLMKTTRAGGVIPTKQDDMSGFAPPLAMLPPAELRNRFEKRGTLTLAAVASGRFKTAFPDGVVIDQPDTDNDTPPETQPTSRKTGLTEASETCNVVVFADVDFLTDAVAYQQSLFGIARRGDNVALLLNALDVLGGSPELVQLRTRGRFRRGFDVVDKMEKEAEERTAEKLREVQSKREQAETRLQELASKHSGDTQLLKSALLAEENKLYEDVRTYEAQEREIQRNRREGIEALGRTLRNLNMFAAPGGVLLIAIGLAIVRRIRRRRYVHQPVGAETTGGRT
ncbi:MAG: GldG family protein [Phycisphaerae bacterium]|nr:GldG family protein [Phycisphaerae bacterium]